MRVSAIPGHPPAVHTYCFLRAQGPRAGCVTQTHNLHSRTGSCEIFPQETCESAAAWPGAGISGETQTSRDHMVLTQVSTPRRFQNSGLELPKSENLLRRVSVLRSLSLHPHTGAQGSRPAPALGSRLAGASAAPGSRLARLPAPASRARRHLAPAPLSDGGEQRAPHRPPSGIR